MPSFKKFPNIFFTLAALICFQLPAFSAQTEIDGATQKFAPLSSGNLSYREKNPLADDTIVYVHINSSSGEMWTRQLASPLFSQRQIAPDLPGHGDSENALDPKATYSFAGYARSIIELMDSHLAPPLQKKALFCGASLGGHVVIEILRLRPDLVNGILLTGTPPIDLNPEGLKAGFRPCSGARMMSQETFTDEEVREFTTIVFPNPEPFMLENTRRTEGRARSLMIADAVSGTGISQRDTVEKTDVPIAFVIGTKDEGINADYIKSLSYRNPPQILELEAGHDTFWEPYQEFNRFLSSFARDVFEEKVDSKCS